MIRPKIETEDLLISITKFVKHLLNKLIENQKKHWNLNLPNQEKHFISIHQLTVEKIGGLD